MYFSDSDDEFSVDELKKDIANETKTKKLVRIAGKPRRCACYTRQGHLDAYIRMILGIILVLRGRDPAPKKNSPSECMPINLPMSPKFGTGFEFLGDAVTSGDLPAITVLQLLAGLRGPFTLTDRLDLLLELLLEQLLLRGDLLDGQPCAFRETKRSSSCYWPFLLLVFSYGGIPVRKTQVSPRIPASQVLLLVQVLDQVLDQVLVQVLDQVHQVLDLGSNCESCVDGKQGYNKLGCRLTASNKCNDNGTLKDAKCVCNPGWGGDNCNEFKGNIPDWKSASDRKYVSVPQGGLGVCPEGYVAIAGCASGKDLSCVNPSDSKRKPVSGFLTCSKLPSGIDNKIDEKWIDRPDSKNHQNNPWDQTCPPDYFLAGACLSGKNPDCLANDLKTRIRGKALCRKFRNLRWIGPEPAMTYLGADPFESPAASQGTAVVRLCNGGENISDCHTKAFGNFWTTPMAIVPGDASY
eukprot:jgi/Bigna1/136843/aug1.36_g11551